MNQTIESAPITNLTQLRDELDWQENRQAYVEWHARKRFESATRSATAFLLAGLMLAIAYILRLGG